MKFKLVFILILAFSFLVRFWGLSQFPPSLYWEEVALGYDAYSILETGRDHHGNAPSVVAFESFGDWKPVLYFYVLVPFIRLLGLTELAVRLPSVLSGVMIVWGVGVLAKIVYASASSRRLQLLAMFLAAISPWAIQFSRAGWEVNLATALILWGVVLFIQVITWDKTKSSSSWTRKKWITFLGSITLLSLSMYAYHAARVVSPLLGLGLIIIWFNSSSTLGFRQLKVFITRNAKQLIVAAGLISLLLSPLLLSLGEETTQQRFAETSIFSDLSIIEESNARKEALGNSLLSRAFYHRYLLFGGEVFSNFLSHFNPNFLFISGDNNPRHSIQFIGQLYYVEAIFLVLGFYYVIKRKNKLLYFLLFWLVVGTMPAAITKSSPHALRILLTMPVFITIISLGIAQLLTFIDRSKLIEKSKLNKKLALRFFWLALAGVYLVQFSQFWRYYSKIYPQVYSSEWQFGYKEMVLEIEELRLDNLDLPVYISRYQGRPAMYYWFYTKTDPEVVQENQKTAKKDQGEFLEFENISFINSESQVSSGQALIASSLEGFEQLKSNREVTNVTQIKNPLGEVVWVVYRTIQ